MTLNHWREASTVIVAAANSSCKNLSSRNYNYKLLALKRSEKSQFMPGSYVFPGGVKHKSDSTEEWMELFKKFNINSSYVQNVQKLSGSVPPIFKNENNGEVSKMISLRITAIRETFEETGVLLCKTRQDVSGLNGEQWVSYQSNPDLPQWRIRVQEHPEEFINLCHHFDCFPDIWGLHVWSNWLTPKYEHKKRFDAAFFIATLKNFPESVPDEAEVVKSAWLSPQELIDLCKKDEIWLPPPQYYEVARLLQFPNIEDLLQFSTKRSVEGCERWMPERYRTTDGILTILPGDHEYPDNPDFTTGTGTYTQLEKTLAELRDTSKVCHRFEQKSDFSALKFLISNLKAKYGHVLPLPEDECKL